MRFPVYILCWLLCLALPHVAYAHFGMIIPSDNMILTKNDAKCTLRISFSHPFAGHGMDMDSPQDFFVVNDGKVTSLLNTLQPSQYKNGKCFVGAYTISRPGVYQFAMIPAPYFEPAEDSFIIHYTKTIVGAYGAEEGWNVPLGLPMEIVPLTRPFGNYAGNVFTGQVLKEGKPLANAVIEVENLNDPPEHIAPNTYFETQTLVTDAQGIFTFGIPWAGWWGFAALASANEKLAKDDELKEVELGGVIWVRFAHPQRR